MVSVFLLFIRSVEGKLCISHLDTFLEPVDIPIVRPETIEIRDATIPFFQNRSDPAISEDRSIPIQSDIRFFF